MRSLFSAAASLSFSLSLSASRTLPFESPRHRRISTCQRSYSPLDRASSRRAFVAPPSFILASSSERSEAKTRRVLLSRTSGAQSHRRRCPVFLPPPFFSTLLPFFVNDAIALTTLSLVLAFGALLPSSFSPFSLVSHFSVSNISPVLLLFFYFCSSFFLRNFLPSRSFTLFPLCLFLVLPSFSVLLLLLYLHSSRKGQTRISFSFLPFQH